MADWGQHAADYRVTNGVCFLTPNATAHTKSSWVTLSGGDPERCEGFYLTSAWLGTHTTARTILFDVGAGAGPTSIISNLMVCPTHVSTTSTTRAATENIFFPVALPPAESIKLRAQSSMASHSECVVLGTMMRSGLPCAGSIVDTYGADTANTKGTTLTASTTEGVFGAWEPVSASCERIKALMIAVGHGQQDWSTFDDQWSQIQIGIGAGGSEIEVARIPEIGTGSGFRIPSQAWLGPFYLDIPAGARLSARVAKQHSSASQRTIDVILYGIR